MQITHFHQWLTAPVDKASKSQVSIWFCLSLAFAALYGGLALHQAFSGEYVVQDDARQHVFWMRRFLDPELFPDNLIADYFQAVAPAGYTFVYQAAAAVGIDPMVFNKILPMILGLITTGYCFGVSLQIFPVPAGAFLSTLLLNQALWIKDDLPSATPRAFLYPLFVAFLYYFLRRSLWPCLVAIALQGLFYPQTVFITSGVLALSVVGWNHGRPCLSRDRNDYIFCVAGLVVAFVVMLPYALQSSEYGPTISLAAARGMEEFGDDGRSRFFTRDPFEFWLVWERSGIFPNILKVPALFASLSLPFLLRMPRRFPLAAQVKPEVHVLTRIVVASVAMFFAAHLLLFKLQLPSRYTWHSFRVVFAIAAGIAILLLVDAVLTWGQSQRGTGSAQQPRRATIALSVTGIIAALLVLYPHLFYEFPDANYKEGEAPALYEFFASQPKDTLVAALTEEEGDYIPSLSNRSVLVAREYAIPYQLGYYRQFRQQAEDLIQAQYTPDLEELKDFIRQYGIDFWLLEENAFTVDYVERHNWMGQYQPAASEALKQVKRGPAPALKQATRRCEVLNSDEHIIVEAACILDLRSR